MLNEASIRPQLEAIDEKMFMAVFNEDEAALVILRGQRNKLMQLMDDSF